MRKVFTIIATSIIFLVIVLLIYINIGLRSVPDFESREKTKQSVIHQLNYLEDELKNNNMGFKMQELFPEGFVFSNVLYGLAWTEVGKGEKNNSELYSHALSEARFAYRQINSKYARRNFDTELNPKFGIFYCGWKNYLLAKILALQNKKDSSEIAEFDTNCTDIAYAIDNTQSPFPKSYVNASWPADAFVAAASLKLHDRIFESKYDTLIKNWLLKVKSNLDNETKLVPHSTLPETGKKIEGTRGSSICLMLIFLADIDSEFAQQQYRLFIEKFQVTRFGLPAIREYPTGKKGSGDIDSGPVILDIGFSATIVAVGTLNKFGDFEQSGLISGCIEGFGFPLTTGYKKKYLFGRLPVADAFIAWSRIMEPDSELIQCKDKNNYTWGSFFPFHLVSVVVILILLLFIFRNKIKKKQT